MKKVNVKVTDEQAENIKEQARAEKKTVSEYIRSRVLPAAEARKKQDEAEGNEFIQTLRSLQTRLTSLEIAGSELRKKISEGFSTIGEALLMIKDEVQKKK